MLAGGYGQHAWRHPAATFSWLITGDPTIKPPLDLELPLDHYRRLQRLFAQRRNLARPGHWKMLGEILRFNTRCKQLIERDAFAACSLGDFLQQEHYSSRFRNHYLLPMAAAIWSCPPQAMLDFPAASFARFFENHGLLDLRDRPQRQTAALSSQGNQRLSGGHRRRPATRDQNRPGPRQ